MKYTALRHLGASLMKKVIIALVVLLALGCGYALAKPERLTVSLFLHYLFGGGQELTIKDGGLVTHLCPNGRTGHTSAYDTRYEYALGRFTCKGDSAYDVYDFDDKDRRDFCMDLRPHRLRHEIPSDIPYLVGKCLVGLDYGEPYKLHIIK